jgi:hemoglobin
MDTTTTLYDRLGGEQAIESIVNDFYKDVLADDTVNRFFANTDMEQQRRHQTAFISYALGGPKQYTGRSMELAHEGLNLQPQHFDAIVKHLSDALAAHGVSAEEISAVIGHVATLKEAILYM